MCEIGHSSCLVTLFHEFPINPLDGSVMTLKKCLLAAFCLQALHDYSEQYGICDMN